MKKTNTKENNEIIEIPAEEAPYALPDGWKWVRISSLFDIYTGNSINERIKAEKYFGQKNGLPFIATKDIDFDNQINYANGVRINDYEKFKIAPANTPLLCIEGGSAGRKIGFITQNVCFGNKLCCFKCKNDLIIPILGFYILQSQVFRVQFNNLKHGLIGGVSVKDISSILFPLPPLETQKRIVERIESLFAKLDEAKEKAQTALDGFELRKSAILHKAFTGQLTAKWRSSCRPSDISSAPAHIESAPADISSSAPAEHIDSDASITAEHFVNISSVPNSLSPKQVCSELSEQALPNSSLPNGWLKKCFADVANIKLNLVEPSDYPNFPHIAPDSIEKKTGVLLTYRTVAEDKVTSAKHRFYPGQILYSKIRPYLSKVVIIDFDGLCSADMYPIEAVENTRFLWYYMLSNEFLNQASNAGSRTVLPKINQKELAKISVSLPPLPEQQEIVRILNDLLAKENAAKEAAEAVIDKIDLIKKSILARAFRGEL